MDRNKKLALLLRDAEATFAEDAEVKIEEIARIGVRIEFKSNMDEKDHIKIGFLLDAHDPITLEVFGERNPNPEDGIKIVAQLIF